MRAGLQISHGRSSSVLEDILGYKFPILVIVYTIGIFIISVRQPISKVEKAFFILCVGKLRVELSCATFYQQRHIYVTSRIEAKSKHNPIIHTTNDGA